MPNKKSNFSGSWVCSGPWCVTAHMLPRHQRCSEASLPSNANNGEAETLLRWPC